MLKYDSANVKITNYPEANAWLSRNISQGLGSGFYLIFKNKS